MYTKVKLGFPFLNRAKAEIGFAYGRLNDYYFQTSNMTFPNATTDHSRYDLFAGSLSIERNSLDYKQYPISGRKQFLVAQYVTGTEKYMPSPITDMGSFDRKVHSWLQMKGEWEQYKTISPYFNLGFMSELVLSSKNLMNNYTASVLQAPAFTPTPHSQIVFNEAFRANQYVAFGLSPILKFSKLLHFRLDMYGFAPLYEIKKKKYGTITHTRQSPITGNSFILLNIWEKQPLFYNCLSLASACMQTDTAIQLKILILA